MYSQPKDNNVSLTDTIGETSDTPSLSLHNRFLGGVPVVALTVGKGDLKGDTMFATFDATG